MKGKRKRPLPAERIKLVARQWPRGVKHCHIVEVELGLHRRRTGDDPYLLIGYGDNQQLCVGRDVRSSRGEGQAFDEQRAAFCMSTASADDRDHAKAAAMEQHGERRSNPARTNNTHVQRLLRGGHLIYLEESGGEVPDDSVSVAGDIAGIAVEQHLRSVGSEMFGSVQNRHNRSASTRLNMFIFELLH